MVASNGTRHKVKKKSRPGRPEMRTTTLEMGRCNCCGHISKPISCTIFGSGDYAVAVNMCGPCAEQITGGG